MSRKRIALLVVLVLVLVLGLVAWRLIRIATMGVEDLGGPQAPIPEAQGALPPLTRGAADWPCWRGAGGNGKSSQQGIRKDWSGGLRRLWEVDYLCQGSAASTWAAPVVQGNRLVGKWSTATNCINITEFSSENFRYNHQTCTHISHGVSDCTHLPKSPQRVCMCISLCLGPMFRHHFDPLIQETTTELVYYLDC